jgi:hypothetical protein
MFGSSDDEDVRDSDHVGTVAGGTLQADREVHRLVDEEAGVVLYVLAGQGQHDGIATVPIEETDLGGGGWD